STAAAGTPPPPARSGGSGSLRLYAQAGPCAALCAPPVRPGARAAVRTGRCVWAGAAAGFSVLETSSWTVPPMVRDSFSMAPPIIVFSSAIIDNWFHHPIIL
ncbi:unnamed protein product, partial [Urochloa humidicola]